MVVFFSDFDVTMPNNPRSPMLATFKSSKGLSFTFPDVTFLLSHYFFSVIKMSSFPKNAMLVGNSNPLKMTSAVKDLSFISIVCD